MGNYKNNSNSRNNIFIICFIVVAIASVIVCIIGKNALDKSYKKSVADSTVVKNDAGLDSSAVDNSDPSDKNEENEDNEEISEEKAPNAKVIGFPAYKEISLSDEVIAGGKQNTTMVPLSDLADEKDVIESLTFVFRSENGVSNLGEVKLGFGISLDENCPYSTTSSWYQTTGDLYYTSDGVYCTALWTVPENIRSYVNNEGNVLFGYWWGDYTKVILEKVSCQKTANVEFLSDGTKETSVNSLISQNPDNSLVIPLSSVLKEDTVPQMISIKLRSESGNISDMDYTLGVTTSIKSDDNYYYNNDKLIGTGSDEAFINWIVPDLVKNLIDPEGSLYIKLNGENIQNIKIDSVVVDYTET